MSTTSLPEEQTGLSLCEQLHPSAWLWRCACLCPSSLWVHLWIQTCELCQDFILCFFSIRSYSVTRLVQGQINPSLPTYGTAGSCCAETGHLHSCAHLCPQAAWQRCPSLADLGLCIRWHPVSTPVGKPSLEQPSRASFHPLSPSPCPVPAPVPLRWWGATRGTRRGPSVQDSIYLSHDSGLLAIWSCHYKSPWYDLTEDLLLTAQRSVPVLAAFRTFRYVLRVHLVAAGLDTPDAQTAHWLKQPCDHRVCFPSTRVTTNSGLKSLHTFVKLALSHQALGNYCLFLTPSSASLRLKVASCCNGRNLEEDDAISRPLVVAGFVARLGHPKDLNPNRTEAHKLKYCCTTQDCHPPGFASSL